MVTGPRFWNAWKAERDLRRSADRYIHALYLEPSDDDVRWLSALMLRRDEDHARWELRYARRALGLLAAERDALNDKTAQVVALALQDAIARDANVAADRVEVAEQQFNARLGAYRTAMAKRDGKESMDARLARELLTFASAITGDHAAAIAQAGAILTGYLATASDRLREAFGTAALPEDVPPSHVAPKG